MIKNFSQRWRLPLLLVGFTAIATGLVAGVHQLTANQIEQNQYGQLAHSLKNLLVVGSYDNDLLQDTFSVNDQTLLHLPKASTGYRARLHQHVVAVLLPVVAPDGYSGAIQLLVAINRQGEILAVNVVSQHETAGLGDAIEAEKSDWLQQFVGKSLSNPSLQGWHVKRDQGEFDQLTGATITPRAVVAAIQRSLLYFQQHQHELLAEPSAATTALPTTPQQGVSP